jgi:hypothetical protein
MSECPPIYLETECNEISAPSKIGDYKYGVAKVLSTNIIHFLAIFFTI